MLVKVRGFFLPILTSKSAELILGFDPLLYLLTCKMNQFSSPSPFKWIACLVTRTFEVKNS